MLNRSQTTTFLQIFYELLLYFQVILKSMRVSDGTLEGISECEWVKIIFIFILQHVNTRYKNIFTNNTIIKLPKTEHDFADWNGRI